MLTEFPQPPKIPEKRTLSEDVKMFKLSLKDYFTIVFVMFVITGVCFGVSYFVNYMNRTNIQFQEQLIRLTDSSMKREGIRANDADAKKMREEFDKEKSEILKAFEEQKKITGEVLDELGQVKSEMAQTRKLRVASDKIYKKETQDPKHWYFFKIITVKNAEGEEVPVAWAMFYPYQTPDKQWKYGTYELKVDTKIIESENDDGSFNRYAETNILGKDDKKLPVKMKDVKWEKFERSLKRFYYWNPRLALGTSVTGDGEASLGLNMSMSSYGRTKRDMDWRFFTIGGGLRDQNPFLMVEPFGWNIGTLFPLVENLFVGPMMSFDMGESISYGFQLSVPF